MPDIQNPHESLLKSREKIEELEKKLDLLQADYDRLETVLSDLGTGLADINPDFTINWANKKTSEISHLTNPVGEKCYKIFNLSDKPCNPCPVQKSFKTGESHKVENYNAREKKWYRIFSHPVKNLKGEVTNVIEAVADITEYKKAEIAAVEEKELLDEIMETSPAGITVVDKNGRITKANLRAEEILGFEKSNIYKRVYNDSGWKIKSANGRDYPEEELPFYIVKNNLKPVYGVEHLIIKPEGEKVILSINAAPLFDTKKSFNGMVSVIEDISELKKAYKNLKDTLDATTDGIWAWNFKTDELFFSPRYYKMLEYEDKEFDSNYENWLSLIHPDDRESALKTAEKYLETKPDSYENEFRLKTKSGEYRWFKAKARVAEKDENGEALYLIGNHEDITERKNAEILLKESKKRLSLAIQGADLGTWDWNVKTGEVIFDEYWASMKGYLLSELKPQIETWEEMVHPEDYSFVMEKLNSHLKGVNESYEAEFRIKKKDGTWMWILDKGKVLERDENGNPVRACGTHLNITKKKESQEKQAALEKRLQHLYKMETLGALAGGIAHDFNNILVPIVGLSEMLMDDFPENSTEYNHARDIFNSGMRGSDLVKQILAFSRQSDDKPVPVKFQNIIKDTVQLSKSAIPSDIEIKTDIDSKCGYIKANPAQLHQIVMNLIINAYHAIEPNKGQIYLSLGQQHIKKDELPNFTAGAGDYAVLTVSDTGKGISKEIIDKIFDPYFTTKGKDKGTGLGLAVIQGIVTEYGGSINVSGNPGKGSVFTIYLPLAEKNIKDNNEAEAEPLCFASGSENILFVDDEKPIVKIGQNMLERLGYKVTGVSQSSEALKIFKNDPEKVDIIITDMNMPQMTGIDLAAEIHLLKPGCPIIICTGFSERIDAEKAEKFNINGYLKKPVVHSDMANEVRRVLDESKGL